MKITLRRDWTGDVLFTCLEFLVHHMDPDHGLLNKLKTNLSFEKIEDVKSKKTLTKRNAKLLSYILNDGRFRELIEALRETDQSHIANYLESSGSEVQIFSILFLLKRILCFYHNIYVSYLYCN